MLRHASRIALLLACTACAEQALAHGAEQHNVGATINAWVLICLLAAAGWYALGVARLRPRTHRGASVSGRRIASFSFGLVLLGLALASPLDTLGADLFSAHMLQHEAMMLGAAPLLVAGRPLPVFLWALPPSARMRTGIVLRSRAVHHAWRTLSRPIGAWWLHAVVLWAWHVPRLFQAGLANEAVHVLQHASFLAAALLFWSSVARAGAGMAVLSLLATAIHTGILGALLTFSPHVWYPVYDGRTDAWGLTLLEDQQLGGLIMWVPAGFLLVFAGVAAAARALGQDRERAA
ncbi:cytochrome c oxidase assembly protein [Noviherbaspirillum sp. ST9]|uniref:cytochrome c oxidase assembly protein n=1 Tax=Noviherbaspirillum sp. ST9 TaxID=3401606 RepID=UPI003B58AB1E